MASRGTGLVVGSHTVRAVEVRKKGTSIQLSRVVSLRMDGKTADPLQGPGAGAILANLAAEKIHGGPAFLGLTGKDLVVRYTQVPPVPDWKLETLMRFEIDEVSQQSGGDVSADYAVMDLPAGASSETSVLVAMVKNSLLQPRVKLLEALKKKVVAAVPNSLVLFNSFLWFGDVKEGETTLLVRLGGQNTDIAIAQDGNLIFARNVSGGGDQFTDAIASAFSVSTEKAERMKIQKANVTPKSRARYGDAAEEKIANAIMGVAGQVLTTIQSSIMFARAQTRIAELSVERIVLAGGGANLRGIKEYLETNLGLPVTIFDPLPSLDLSALSEQERQFAQADPAGLVIPLGLATMAVEDGGAFWVQILPESYRKRQEFLRGPLFMIFAAVLVLALIIVLFYTEGRDGGALAASKTNNEQKVGVTRNDGQSFKTGVRKERAGVNLLAKVQELASLNPVLTRAMHAVQKHLIPEIEIKEMKSDWETSKILVDSEEGRGRKDEITRRRPVVIFKGEMTGNVRGAKWAGFIGALKVEPGIAVDDKPLTPRGGIDFRVSFPETKPEAEGDK
jgi:type IV pilus assembly protein PilM